ncbi:hypothetical protein D3C76_1672970 [compost metagenome]
MKDGEEEVKYVAYLQWAITSLLLPGICHCRFHEHQSSWFWDRRNCAGSAIHPAQFEIRRKLKSYKKIFMKEGEYIWKKRR